MTTEANKTFVRRYLEEVFNRRDFTALDRYADEKFKGGVIELLEKLHGALSGFHITVEGRDCRRRRGGNVGDNARDAH